MPWLLFFSKRDVEVYVGAKPLYTGSGGLRAAADRSRSLGPLPQIKHTKK